ncbi:hypothetical protein BH09PLA1_BH09PLA1_21480 [soil metagenome]
MTFSRHPHFTRSVTVNAINQRFLITSLLVLAWLGNVALLAQTVPSTANAPRVDRSTSAATFKALVDAIGRDDALAARELLEFPLTLDGGKLTAFAERFLLGSKLYWILVDKFEPQRAERAIRQARLDYVPRVEADELTWQPWQVPGPFPSRELREGAIGAAPDHPGRVRMVKTAEGWKAMVKSDLPALFALDVEDAPGRSRLVQRVINDIKTGELTTIEQVTAELVLRAPERKGPEVADRSTPAGAIVAARAAIEIGDVATFVDSFDVMGGDDDGFVRTLAEEAVLEKKVEKMIRAKFPQEQAERVVKEVLSRRSVLAGYESVAGWVEDGDVARAALKKGWYDVMRRTVRRDRIWRIQFPPRNTMRFREYEEDKLRQVARMKSLQEALDHPEHFATAGELLEALDPARRERAAEEVDAGGAARRQFEEMKREMAKNPPKTPKEREEYELGLALWEIAVAAASKDAPAAAKHYFAKGDDGSYTLARTNRSLAARDLIIAADKEVAGGAQSLSVEFNLYNLADDIYGLLMLELQIQGDRATPKSGDPDGEWIPGVRKIDGVWKIDVTHETAGNPKDAAKRAEAESRKLEALTTQVKAGKFTNLDQLRKAMKEAGIKGAATPRG